MAAMPDFEADFACDPGEATPRLRIMDDFFTRRFRRGAARSHRPATARSSSTPASRRPTGSRARQGARPVLDQGPALLAPAHARE